MLDINTAKASFRTGWLLVLVLTIYWARGWVIAGEKAMHLLHSSPGLIQPDCWHYITRAILDYTFLPIAVLIIALNSKRFHKFVWLFSWSAFGLVISVLLEAIYWRIPNNEPTQNDYITSALVSLIALNFMYQMVRLKIVNDRGEGLFIGLGIGYSAAKTILSKLWLGKLLAWIGKLFALTL